MSKFIKRFVPVIVLLLIGILSFAPLTFANAAVDIARKQSLSESKTVSKDDQVAKLVFTEEEQEFIQQTKLAPIKMGIIPYAFPLSACPPEVPDFVGINLEMLSYIKEKSGLQFNYVRVPIETESPYTALMKDQYEFVAGSIRLDVFMKNPNLLLSERFCDGSAICIAARDTNPEILKTGKIAVMGGYQAGIEFAEMQFPRHEIVRYPSNEDVVVAVRQGKADLAMISRYAGVYKLQSPLNENLVTLDPYQMLVDSCIMGKKDADSLVAMAIFNKVLLGMGADEYNNMSMNFTISNPYVLSMEERFYKYRNIFLVGTIVFLVFSVLVGRLLYTQKQRALLSRDPLTGAMSEVGFKLAAAKVIAKSTRPLFITDFDICYFSNYNELYGKAKGDELLKGIAKIVLTFLCERDMICRTYADNFKVLTSKDDYESLKRDITKASEMFNGLVDRNMVFNFGVYEVVDKTIPIVKMLDFAALAKKRVKGNVEDFVCLFDNTLYERQMREAKLISLFDSAIKNREFIAHYQPKFDVNTREIVGAEALVRWQNADGTLTPPSQFIDLFERNGQLQRLDLYMLEQACLLHKKMSEQNIPLIPISVNFSRNHLYTTEFIPKINAIVEQYDIPKNLIEIECTETAMTYDPELCKTILNTLRDQGYSISMDDFGKAYSSLNSLRSIPLDIIKLDSDFMSSTLELEKAKTKKIIRNMVALAHDLSLKIIAEGVETESQFLFLKSVGCDYIQGYYFSKPLSEDDFLNLLQLPR